MMRREGHDPNQYTISRRGKRMKHGDVVKKRRKSMRSGRNSDDSETYESDGSGNEYEENSIKVQKFNPWQTDIHYGLTVDSEHPANRGYAFRLNTKYNDLCNSIWKNFTKQQYVNYNQYIWFYWRICYCKILLFIYFILLLINYILIKVLISRNIHVQEYEENVIADEGTVNINQSNVIVVKTASGKNVVLKVVPSDNIQQVLKINKTLNRNVSIC